VFLCKIIKWWHSFVAFVNTGLIATVYIHQADFQGFCLANVIPPRVGKGRRWITSSLSFRSGIVERNEQASERELLRDARENSLPDCCGARVKPSVVSRKSPAVLMCSLHSRINAAGDFRTCHVTIRARSLVCFTQLSLSGKRDCS